jgi:peptidoglycan/LPS O-acetylase OafA/YrhL
MAMEFNYYIILLPIFFVLLLTIVGVNKIIPLEIAPVAHPEIDGVRGYLAFFVFLHHSYIWQHYIQTKSWDEPTLNLYNHFGQTSVSLFFGITAFLFTTKILKSTTDFNWGLYLKSRFYRLFPMYFTVTCVIFILIGYYTHLKINTTIGELISTSASWIGFTVAGTLDINGFQNSRLMNSGASWTLPYEWMFYFLLPFLALAMGKKVKPKTLVLFLLLLGSTLYLNQASIRHFMPFIGGIVVAVLVQKNTFSTWLQKPFMNYIALALLVVSVCFFDSGRKPIPLIATSLFFLLIASGNSIFGLLSHPLSRKFGQITYSVYLIHGTLLFVIFYSIIGLDRAAQLTQVDYWSIITVSIVPLLFLSQLTFKYIELPMMQFLKNKKS